MDARRRRALRECHSDLRTRIIVDNFLPRLHIGAGGFLTDVEYANIRESSGNVKQVDLLLDTLLNKEDKDFDHFCDVLAIEGRQAYSKELKAAAFGKRPQFSYHAHRVSRVATRIFDCFYMYTFCALLQVNAPRLHVPVMLSLVACHP